jgi:hypothetical protein
MLFQAVFSLLMGWLKKFTPHRVDPKIPALETSRNQLDTRI